MGNSGKEERSHYHDMLLKYSQAGVTPGTFTAGRGATSSWEAGAEAGRGLEEGSTCWRGESLFREGSGDPAWLACGVSGAGREMILEYGLQPLVRTVSVRGRTMGFCWLNGTL